MPDVVLDDNELARLAMIGEPQAGDDDQTVAFRAMARAMHKVARSQIAVATDLNALKDATRKCEETHEMVESLVSALAPPADPEKHITIRVSVLEKLLAGWRGLAAKIMIPVMIAATLGALGMAWNATVEAAAAKTQVTKVVDASQRASK